jgi:hypothetical protein
VQKMDDTRIPKQAIIHQEEEEMFAI